MKTTCHHCGGEGVIPGARIASESLGLGDAEHVCPTCDGEGWLEDDGAEMPADDAPPPSDQDAPPGVEAAPSAWVFGRRVPLRLRAALSAWGVVPEVWR